MHALIARSRALRARSQFHAIYSTFRYSFTPCNKPGSQLKTDPTRTRAPSLATPNLCYASLSHMRGRCHLSINAYCTLPSSDADAAACESSPLSLAACCASGISKVWSAALADRGVSSPVLSRCHSTNATAHVRELETVASVAKCAPILTRADIIIRPYTIETAQTSPPLSITHAAAWLPAPANHDVYERRFRSNS